MLPSCFINYFAFNFRFIDLILTTAIVWDANGKETVITRSIVRAGAIPAVLTFAVLGDHVCPPAGVTAQGRGGGWAVVGHGDGDVLLLQESDRD